MPILDTIGLNVESFTSLVESLSTFASHRVYQGKILLGKYSYKPFQVVSILFFAILVALYFPLYLLDNNLIVKIVLFFDMGKHLSVYLPRSSTTTPRPLSCFMITILFFITSQ